MSILKVLDFNGIKYCCSKKPITYDEEGKKDKDTLYLTGCKNPETLKKYPTLPKYPVIHNDTYTNFKKCVLYTGEIIDTFNNKTYTPKIIGIDYDLYDSNISVNNKLFKLGFNKEKIKNYKWITITGRGGIHVIVKYEENIDITTTNLFHRGMGKGTDIKSHIDIRGSGAKLICAGTLTTKGDYKWFNGEPTIHDPILPLEELCETLCRSIRNHRLGGLRKNQNKQKKLEDWNKIGKPITPIHTLDTDKNELDIEMTRIFLSKLKSDSDDFTEWCCIGMCIHNEFGASDLGLELFKEFSAYNTDKYDENYCEKQYTYWTNYNIKDAYPYLTRKIIYRYAMERQNNNDMYNIVKQEATKNLLEKKKEGSITSSNIYMSEVYTELKRELEERDRVFKVFDDFRMVKINDDGNLNLLVKSEQTILKIYRNKPPVPYIDDSGKEKTKSFINMWLNDPNMKSYYDCCFRPSKPYPSFMVKDDLGIDREFFNEFMGFRGSKPPPTYNPTQEKKDFMIKIFRDALFLLCEQNEDVYDYTFHFIRKMILYPEQKSMNVMVVWISDATGLGKSSMIDFLFKKVIGEQYAKTSSNLNDVFDKFGEYKKNKIGYCYEEGDLNTTLKLFNKLKDLITGTNDKSERKYGDPKDNKCLLHLFQLTNNYISIKIDETDRRHLVCFNVPFEPPSRMEEHKTNWYKCLDDDDFGYVIYEYITKHKCDSDRCFKHFNYGENIPQTEAKSSIQETFIPVEIQFMKYLIDSEFKDMYYTLNNPDPKLLREFYKCAGNENNLNEDLRIECLPQHPSKDYDNEDTKYKEMYEALNNMFKNSKFIETNKPLKDFITKTDLKNKKPKDKYLELIRNELIKLGFDTKIYSEYKDMYDLKSITDDDAPQLLLDRQYGNYIRMDMVYFVKQMKYWRTCNNACETKKSLNNILNTFRVVFKLTKEEELIQITEEYGNKMIYFNKEEVINRINEKYKFAI